MKTTYEQQLPFHQVQSGDVFLLHRMEESAEQLPIKIKISFNYIELIGSNLLVYNKDLQ